METIFDHNPSKKELARFFGSELADKANSFKDKVYRNEDDANYALGILFSMRKDIKRANTYFRKIKNVDLLRAFMQDF